MATLSWNVQRAVTVAISPGIGTVASSGTLTVSPSVATTYTMTATDRRGRVTTASVTVTPSVSVGSPVGTPVGTPVGAPVGSPVG
jgi:hypothetical protein